MWQIWLLPIVVIGASVALSLPVGRYLAWIMDGRYRAPSWLAWVEGRMDTGPQNWKQYAVSLLLFNTLMFVFCFAALAFQPETPLNPDGQKALGPTTIFNTACSFITNTNLQHYAGEQHLSYFSQIVGILWQMFVSAAVGFSALIAVIRGLRGDSYLGNFYLDMWRGVTYVFLPASLIMGILFLAAGMPMTFAGAQEFKTLEGALQKISWGPVAAILPIKHLGTNGGGFFGANSAHPFENPGAWTNLLECINILLLPFSTLVMFGKMLKNMRHAVVIYGVMMAMLLGMVGWAIYWDTMQPNQVLVAREELKDLNGNPFEIEVHNAAGAVSRVKIRAGPVASLPVTADLGNLEGKELRFGISAGATFAAVTTAVACGSVDCSHDSLNPLAGVTPLSGMWLNCVFGGKGVGLINLLVYLITGVFLAGLMVGRTPEYLGKKVEAREMKFAMLALLIHPIMVLGLTGLFAALDCGSKSVSNPGPHGFSEILYEFSSASANNGSEFGGLQQTWGFNNPSDNISPPAPYSPYWDIATGLVMLISRFIPIIAPLALAACLAAKKPTPFTAGTLRTDTFTFAFVLIGTILLVGALLFLPAAVLGPLAEHVGPIPFGG
jgi:potassium-transporting ATPase potassium-binding subunit